MDWLRTHFTIAPKPETVDEIAAELVVEGDDPKSLGDDPDKPPPGSREEPEGKKP